MEKMNKSQNIKLDESQAPKITENGMQSKNLGDVSGCSDIFNLSEKIKKSKEFYDWINVEDVKEFIRLLKSEFTSKILDDFPTEYIIELIDIYSGDKLNGK